MRQLFEALGNPLKPKSWLVHSTDHCVSYGISAAVGKTGAAIGTEVFTPIQTNLGKRKSQLLY